MKNKRGIEEMKVNEKYEKEKIESDEAMGSENRKMKEKGREEGRGSKDEN